MGDLSAVEGDACVASVGWRCKPSHSPIWAELQARPQTWPRVDGSASGGSQAANPRLSPIPPPPPATVLASAPSWVALCASWEPSILCLLPLSGAPGALEPRRVAPEAAAARPACPPPSQSTNHGHRPQLLPQVGHPPSPCYFGLSFHHLPSFMKWTPFPKFPRIDISLSCLYHYVPCLVLCWWHNDT